MNKIKELENFLEEYNKQIAWTKKIRCDINMYVLEQNQFRYIIDEFLSDEELKIDDIDTESILIGDFLDDDGKTVVEAELFNTEVCDTIYYRYIKDIDEDTYRERKLKVIRQVLDHERKDVVMNLNKYNKSMYDLNQILLFIEGK